METKEFELTKDQQKAKDLSAEGHNLLVTGGAGCGKSTLMREMADEHTILCGPTGASAVQIGGVTASSLFGLPIGVCLESDQFRPARKAEELFASGEIRRIVVDEISMCRADQFSLIDAKLRKICKRDVPMGGIQFVGVGDLGQLPPVLPRKEEKVFRKMYDSPWCFKTMAWDMANIQTVLLREVIRQEDVKQQRILQSIRLKDKFWSKAVDRINEISLDRPTEAVWLCAYNKRAESINTSRYRDIQGTERVYKAVNKGFMPHECPVDKELKLKVGCRVLIKANHPDSDYINGTQGSVVDFDDKGVWVEKDDGDVVLVAPFKWTKHEYVMGLGGLERKEIASFTTIPIKLGYGISVHGSQGITLDAANIDFGNGAFAPGLAYVALSRVKDLTKLFINNSLAYSDIIVDPEVQRFYKQLQEETQ